MKEKNANRLKILEQKWLDGSISDEEAQFYARWYNWKQNQKVFVPDAIAEGFVEHHHLLFNRIVNVLDKEGNKFQLFYKKIQKKKAVRISLLRYGAAATILTFVILSVLFVTNNKRQSNNIATNDVAPGKSGLILTLDNGKKIMLDSIKDGLISVQQGIKVYKRNGRIEYEGTATSSILNTATTDVGRQYEIVLPDHSKVWLNAQSELQYPLTFANNERKVFLKGEAYFEVQHKNNNVPFIVETSNKSIQVLGTHFNVNAYDDNDNIVATLIEGSIAMRSGNNSKIIRPNQAAISSQNNTNISIENVVASNAIMWMKREFNFEDLTLSDIMKLIERWYGVKVAYQPDVNRNARFAGSTPMNQNLSEVLKVLELSGIHFQLENKTLKVMN